MKAPLQHLFHGDIYCVSWFKIKIISCQNNSQYIGNRGGERDHYRCRKKYNRLYIFYLRCLSPTSPTKNSKIFTAHMLLRWMKVLIIYLLYMLPKLRPNTAQGSPQDRKDRSDNGGYPLRHTRGLNVHISPLEDI